MTEYARVYGGSLYDLAAEEKLSDIIMEQMLEIKELFRENPDYIKLLSEPSIKKDERLKLIEDAFGSQAERYLVSFIKLLCEKNILNEFEGCLEHFKQRYNSDHNISEAVVTSAVKLTDEQLASLKNKLEKMSGKTITLIEKNDASLLAGMKVEMEGKLLDGSVAGRLAGISKALDETIM